MRLILSIIFLLIFEVSSGQLFSYPEVRTSGQSLSDFIPFGWTILDSTKGDLNKDGMDDMAFVLQYKDSVPIAITEYAEIDTVIAQPRMLLMVFKDTNSSQYNLTEQSNTFILTHDNPNMEEPFQGISISKGILKIEFNIFMNAGGWDTFTNIYKFRYQDKEFKLVGADYHNVNRGSGETEDRSYNFITREVKVSTGTISSYKLKTKWRTLAGKELQTFQTFRQPFSWKVEKDFYL